MLCYSLTIVVVLLSAIIGSETVRLTYTLASKTNRVSTTRRFEKRATSDNASHGNVDDAFWRDLLQNLHIPNSNSPGNFKIGYGSATNPRNAIRDYLIYDEDVLGYTIPIAVRANISHNTLTSTSCRGRIPYVVSNRNMHMLDKMEGYEIGHIIASCNGGPAEIYNLVPQNKNVNHGGQWRQIENSIKSFVQNTDNYVLENVILSYNGTENPQWPTDYTLRPLGFNISLSYYYGNNTIKSNATYFIGN